MAEARTAGVERIVPRMVCEGGQAQVAEKRIWNCWPELLEAGIRCPEPSVVLDRRLDRSGKLRSVVMSQRIENGTPLPSVVVSRRPDSGGMLGAVGSREEYWPELSALGQDGDNL